MEMTTYTLTIRCDHPEWWRFEVILTAQGYDNEQKPCGYYALDDNALSEGGAPRTADSPTAHTSTLLCGPCARLNCYLHILPHTLSEVCDTEDFPAFRAELTLSEGSQTLLREPILVNPWGGATLHLTWPKEE